jgi:hypothetical protein
MDKPSEQLGASSPGSRFCSMLHLQQERRAAEEKLRTQLTPKQRSTLLRLLKLIAKLEL